MQSMDHTFIVGMGTILLATLVYALTMLGWVFGCFKRKG